MIELRRELMLVGAIALIAALALGAQALSDPVEPPEATAAEARHVERGTFCPPPVDEEGAVTQAGIATVSGLGVPVDYEGARTSSAASPPPPENSEVQEGAFLFHNGEEAAFSAVGFGDKPIGGAIGSWSEPVEGAGATLCAEKPSDTWYFPAGSSELGFDERLLLYNPFPDEAVARITFFTPTGPRSKASLDDVAVPSGGWTEVEVNRFMNTQDVLSASVDAVRGRLIAWKVLFAKPERTPPGASFTLGAPEPAPRWYFPQGFLGDGASEVLSILNPTADEVTVTLTTFGSGVGLGPARANEIQLEPETSQDIALEDLEFVLNEGVDLAHVGVVVTSNNGVPIVVERTLSTNAEGVGRTQEVGLTEAGTTWMLPPIARGSSADELIFLNAGRRTAHIDAEIRTLDGTERPKALQDIEVRRAGRIEKSLSELDIEEPFYVVVTSDNPITVERRGSVGDDIADLMGRAVDPPEED